MMMWDFEWATTDIGVKSNGTYKLDVAILLLKYLD